MDIDPLPAGKLPSDLLGRLLAQHSTLGSRVVVGPGVGLDCAVLEVGDRYLVAKTDPITFATDRIGWYAVHVSANDVACSGAAPTWFLAAVLLPSGKADEELATSIFRQITDACASVGAELVGGHTEITHGIDRPVVVGTMLGEVAADDLVTAAGARDGDAVILAGGVPVEAIAIIAREKSEALSGRFEPGFLRRCREFLAEPGISVVKAAKLATSVCRMHSMHDPTEGGLAAGLWELAQASDCGLEIDAAEIDILDEGLMLCNEFDLNPLASIASGALLMTMAGSDAALVQSTLESEGISCSLIGKAIAAERPVVHWHADGNVGLLEYPQQDEITRLFG